MAALIRRIRTDDRVDILESTTVPSTAVLILLHGYGGSSLTMEHLAEYWLTEHPYLRIVIPNAPEYDAIPVPMQSWYHVNDTQTQTSCDEIWHVDRVETVIFQGVEESRNRIVSLIEQEIQKGLAPSRIMLGGFSQGSALALYVAYQYKYALAGCIMLSGRLPYTGRLRDFAALVTSTSKHTHGLFCHGTADRLVPLPQAQSIYNMLKNIAGVLHMKFETYQGLAHCTNYEELGTVSQFITQCMQPIPQQSLKRRQVPQTLQPTQDKQPLQRRQQCGATNSTCDSASPHSPLLPNDHQDKCCCVVC